MRPVVTPNLTSTYFVEDQTVNGIGLQDVDFPKYLKWKTLFINGSSYLKIALVIFNYQGNRKYFATKTDTIKKTISFYNSRGSKEENNTFTYESLGNKKYKFEGVYQGDIISLITKAKTKDEYRLIQNKVKWIRDLE